MARSSAGYADWLERRKNFESDSEFAEVFGPSFARAGHRYESMLGRGSPAVTFCVRRSPMGMKALRAELEAGDLASVPCLSRLFP